MQRRDSSAALPACRLLRAAHKERRYKRARMPVPPASVIQAGRPDFCRRRDGKRQRRRETKWFLLFLSVFFREEGEGTGELGVQTPLGQFVLVYGRARSGVGGELDAGIHAFLEPAPALHQLPVKRAVGMLGG